MAKDSEQTQHSRSAEELERELQSANEQLRVERAQNDELGDICAALEAERRRYRELFDCAPDGYLVTDLGGNVQQANRSAARLLGEEPEHLTNTSLASYVEEPDLTRLQRELGQLQRGEQVPRWEMRLFPRAGRPVDVAVKVNAAGNGHATDLCWSIRDVSEHKQAQAYQVSQQKEMEASLGRHFQLLEKLIAEAPVGIAVISGPDHRFELANACFCAIPGIPDLPVLGRTVTEVFPQAVAGGVLAFAEEGYRTGDTVSLRGYEASVGPGRERTFWDGELVPLVDAGGEVERLLVIAHEVTDEVLARERIEELAARFQHQAEELNAVLDSMVECVVVYDDANRLVRANRAAREAYGTALESRNRIEIRRWLNLRYVDGQVVALDESPVDRALRGEVVQGERYRFAHARNGDCIVSASAVPLLQEGRVVGAVAVWHDVTAQVRAESEREAAARAVRESEEKLRTLVQILPLDITVVGRDGQITHLNPGYNRTIDLPGLALRKGTFRPEVYIRPDGSVLPLDEFPGLRALLKGEVVRSVEFGMVQEDGQVTWANVNAAPLPFHDWRAIIASVDVTEQVEARRALERQNRELQELTAELEAYDYTVAHDLKNPLSMIVGSADLLTHALENLEGKDAQRVLRGILRGSLRLKEIVDSLLLLSNSRSEEVEIGPVDMDQIVASARQDVAALAEKSGAHVAAPASWPAALGHAPWLQSVWANYLSNAIKYGGDLLQIELGAEEQQDDGMVRFWVRDSGPGLTEEQQAKLFVKFSRLDRPEQLGHGLGLAIVRRIVERLGGQVGVDSQVGEGSTFWFTLPAA